MAGGLPQPLMGSLTGPRVTPARPFLNTGVDYAGPELYTLTWLRTTPPTPSWLRCADSFLAEACAKRCTATAALILSVPTHNCAICSLQAARRADASPSASPRRGSHGALIPPRRSNFGGIWEAAVKSTKHHLRRVIGEATLTYEKMATLLSEVEACLNSRPLQALTDDPEDLCLLTPGHFLIGSALSAVPEPSLTEEKTARLSRWQQVQQMRDHFWARWSQEYLQTLAHRPSWLKADVEVRAGRLCLLRSETTPPTKWPLARIEELFPGDDGQIRVVKVRTAASTLTRPVSKLVLLPDCDAPESEE
ncbi:uncharacterized protein [Temnothorax nylanderi]|uniref:uncharacterized protein n=1 Tax=Temnothorax nylanderi TaxID=102681 RepID=UPI003A86BE52